MTVPTPLAAGRTQHAAPDQWDFEETEDYDWYYLTDVQFSVRALVPTGAKQPVHERARYDAYGRGRQTFDRDANTDGNVDSTDASVIGAYDGIDIANVAYRAEWDLNRDGIIDADVADFGRPEVAHNGSDDHADGSKSMRRVIGFERG